MDSTASLVVGMNVSGTGIPTGAHIIKISSATQFVINEATTGGSKTNQELTFTSGLFLLFDTKSQKQAVQPTINWILKVQNTGGSRSHFHDGQLCLSGQQNDPEVCPTGIVGGGSYNTGLGSLNN